MGAAVLLVQKDGETIRRISLDGGGEADLGRADGCAIRLDDRAISRNHAVFRATAEGVQVERKSEFAPLSVNGAECTRAYVREGDVVEIGPYRLRLARPGESAGPSSGAAPSSPAESTPSTPLALDPASPLAPTGPVPASPPVAVAPTLVEAMPANVTPNPTRAPAPATEVSGSFDLNSFAPSSSSSPVASGSAAIEATSILSELSGLDAGSGSGSLALEIAAPAPTSAGLAGGFEGGSGGETRAGGTPADPDAATRVVGAGKIEAKVVFSPGTPNAAEFALGGPGGKDEISIGRSKECDIVIDDKKASRRNSVVARQGNRFVLRDLGSSNGTYLNGRRIAGDEFLSGDDRIRIGSAEFAFVALSRDFAEREGQLIAPPVESTPVDFAAPATAPAPLPSPDPGYVEPDGGAAPVGIAGLPGAQASAAGDRSLVARFRRLPPRQQLLVGLLLLGGVYWLTEDDAPPPPPPRAAATAKVAGTPSFDALPAEQKKFVENTLRLALELHKGREYDKCLFELAKIHSLLPEYLNSRELERYAREGKRRLELLEEERRRKEAEIKLRTEILALVEQAAAAMKRKDHALATALFGQILERDPENPQVAAWRKDIADAEAERVAEIERQRVRRQINDGAWARLGDGVALRRRGKHYEAIDVFKEVLSIGASDAKIDATAKDEIRSALAELKSRRDPVLAEAKAAEQAGELSKAYGLYEKASEIDVKHADSYAGMDRIRGTLHERAKGIYTEGVLAESYSDFEVAKRKFKECLEVAPRDDIYHERAERKLRRYPAAAGGGSP